MHGVADRQLVEPIQERFRARAVHVFQHHEMPASGRVVAHRQTVDDIRMIEHGNALGLAVESGQGSLVAGELLREHLDGDLAFQLFVIAKIDRSHAAAAQPPENADFAQTPRREAGAVARRVGCSRCGRTILDLGSGGRTGGRGRFRRVRIVH